MRGIASQPSLRRLPFHLSRDYRVRFTFDAKIRRNVIKQIEYKELLRERRNLNSLVNASSRGREFRIGLVSLSDYSGCFTRELPERC